MRLKAVELQIKRRKTDLVTDRCAAQALTLSEERKMSQVIFLYTKKKKKRTIIIKAP